MKRPRGCVALVWHMHQPDYRDPATGAATQPWVRLHAAHDYLPMARLAAERSGARMTFNVTPVLLDQLEALARGGADEWEVLAAKPADALTDSEKLTLLRQCFMTNWERRVDPVPRYRELLDRRGRGDGPPDARVLDRFSAQDFRDLVVLFHLSWIHPDLIDAEPALRTLRGRGRGWTEADRDEVLAAIRAACAATLQAWRELRESGAAEIATSPWAHPIGPLLLDQGAARESRPGTPLPTSVFAGQRDAEWHLAEGLRTHERLLGGRPAGLWPSEGGVSEAFLALATRHGLRWAASDDAILRASVGKSAISGRPVAPGPWRHGPAGSGIALFFRDHHLSDLIGFVYARWDPAAAAADFIRRLRDAVMFAPVGDGDPPPLITVILDGENAWEYYHESGRAFLRALYAGLAGDAELEMVTPSGFLDRWPATRELPRIQAGSWIHGDFSIWMGHDEDRRAWALTARARSALLEKESSLPPADFDRGWRHLMVAEGSDWTWWYGDDHSTALGDEFDALFRGRLAAVWRAAGLPVPADLGKPVHGGSAPRAVATPPTDRINLILDGRVTSYFEWLPAGRFEIVRSGSAMHRTAHLVESLLFGVDASGGLVVRLDPVPDARALAGLAVVVRLKVPVPATATIRLGATGWEVAVSDAGDAKVDARAAGEAILEVLLRLDPEASRQPGRSFSVELQDGADGSVLDRWPSEGTIEFNLPGPADPADWAV